MRAPDITVHLVFNAHLDPAWLWPWQSGLDEALATCRSACERLEAHRDLTFTRGEAWVYRQVEACDPALFARIRALMDQGRWHVIGGWWIQPDCNGPSAWAKDRQAELGLEAFDAMFGIRPRTAYNVDSFGHAAYLPELMTRHGQDRYVMMRPKENEMALPARAFRWRGYEGGPEVTVFRIAGSYCTGEIGLDHIQRSLEDLPAGSRHTMCFVGVGDHGGGPTELQIAWLREHWNDLPGVKLEFSDPDRYFDALEAEATQLPLVTGELQHHAVGCYTVCRDIKSGVRRAEHLLKQAEAVAPEANLRAAWQRVAMAHFHDVYGGTCIPSAYPQVEDGLGFARATADEILQVGLRRRLGALPEDEHHRIVMLNASDRPFTGWVEWEPWLGHIDGSAAGLERCADGSFMPAQVMRAEASCVQGPRLLFRAELAPGELSALRVKPNSTPSTKHAAGARNGELWNDATVLVRASEVRFGAGAPLHPRLQLIDDPTDTWSHDVDRYAEDPCGEAEWGAPVVIDDGPLMASCAADGRIGESRLEAEWRVYAGEPFAEWLLTVHWLESRKVLKLTVPLCTPADSRIDGVMGGILRRPADGAERPLRDLVKAGDVTVVCPDAFALDGTPERVRLTLLRSAIMAHHIPHDGSGPRLTISDQGVHRFRIRFYAPEIGADRLDADAISMQRPPVIADLTRGMKA